MRLTFHGTLLAVILILLAMMAIGPARQLYDEEQTIHGDQATLAAGTAETNRLNTRLSQLRDPAFVEYLAREDLGYVAPGETSYVVVRPGQATPPAPLPTTKQAPARQTAGFWLRQAWNALTRLQ
jgi:cell division protein FtsB